MIRLGIIALGALALLRPVEAEAQDARMDWGRQVTSNLVRLGHVEWRLRLNSAGRCESKAAAAGFTLDYIGAYDVADRNAMRWASGLGDLPQILSLEQGSPAQIAGLLPGDALVSIGGMPVSALAKRIEDPALLADAIQDEIARTPPGEKTSLSIMRNGERIDADLAPLQVCAARFILKVDDAIAAHTDGSNIAVTTGLMRFTENDDELALVAGHELAHVVAFDAMPAGLFGQRQQEDAADLNGARIAYCAGYSVSNALSFWRRLAQQREPEDATHRSAKERLSRMADAIVQFASDKGVCFVDEVIATSAKTSD